MVIFTLPFPIIQYHLKHFCNLHFGCRRLMNLVPFNGKGKMAAAFSCRICREKFNVSKLLSEASASEGYSIVSTQCGHLFHKKCLEGALTNQKLLHMRHGRGPLRRFCPVPRCNSDIPSEDFIIAISFDEDEREDSESFQNDNESKLVKRIQSLTNEKDKLKESMERANSEIETLHSVLDEIKYDLCKISNNSQEVAEAEIQSFLKDDHIIRKGDLIFWVTKDGGMVPGKILEIRKKPGENMHYAVVKLDKKTKVPGVGPHAVNRDTLILPLTDFITFKSFFKEFVDKFQERFDVLMSDLTLDIQELASPTGSEASDRSSSSSSYRSMRKFARPTRKPSFGSIPQNMLDEMDTFSVDSVPMPVVRKNSQAEDTKEIKVSRSKTIHYGVGNEPRRIEKCRSHSWATGPTASQLTSPTSSDSSRASLGFLAESLGNSQEDTQAEFIKIGERVIWYDSFSQYEQTGMVMDICEFSPCAIVIFDEHPIVKHKFRYRTINLDELFPYDLASPEDKHRIAEIYGQMDNLEVESRTHIFTIATGDSNSDGEESA